MVKVLKNQPMDQLSTCLRTVINQLNHNNSLFYHLPYLLQLHPPLNYYSINKEQSKWVAVVRNDSNYNSKDNIILNSTEFSNKGSISKLQMLFYHKMYQPMDHNLLLPKTLVPNIKMVKLATKKVMLL